MHHLQLKSPKRFVASFYRDNLTYEVRPKLDTHKQLIELLQDRADQAVIIYCYSQKDTEKIADDLRASGFNALSYHAGMEPEQRRRTQEGFINGAYPNSCRYRRFRNGHRQARCQADSSHLFPRFAGKLLPADWAGRARDGLPSDCVLLYSYGDKSGQDFFISLITDKAERERAQDKLAQIIEFCELQTCRRRYLLQYFGDDAVSNSFEKNNCQGCDICLTPREEFDANGTRAEDHVSDHPNGRTVRTYPCEYCFAWGTDEAHSRS